jgi:hypothetical protein
MADDAAVGATSRFSWPEERAIVSAKSGHKAVVSWDNK